MHPILTRRSRLLLYLGVWVVFGLLIAVVLIYGGRAPTEWALEFAVPLLMAAATYLVATLSLWALLPLALVVVCVAIAHARAF